VKPAEGVSSRSAAGQIIGLPNTVEVPTGKFGANGFGVFSTPIQRPPLLIGGSIDGLPADGRDE
jgi:hypothetical protein